MKLLAARVGDRMLSLFLTRVDAGACYPLNGKPCGCHNHHQYYYDCYEVCRPDYNVPC